MATDLNSDDQLQRRLGGLILPLGNEFQNLRVLKLSPDEVRLKSCVSRKLEEVFIQESPRRSGVVVS